MSNSGHHDCSKKAVFLCTAVKLQSCHMLAHWTQHTGPFPPFNQHSSNSFSCSMKFTREKPWCPVSIFSYFHGKAFPGKPATITFGENKDVSWIKFRLLYDNSFAPALGGACAMGTNTMALIQTCQIQAIMTVPKRLSFSVQLSNCNLATCWHIELSILGLFHLSISIRAIALVALWNSRGKNLDVQCLHFPISMGRLSPANLQQSPSAKTRMCHGSNSDCCMTILLCQPWEELVPWEPTPWHWSKHVKFRPSWLFQKGCLSLHSCQTAILPHVGTSVSWQHKNLAHQLPHVGSLYSTSAFHSGNGLRGGLKELPWLPKCTALVSPLWI